MKFSVNIETPPVYTYPYFAKARWDGSTIIQLSDTSYVDIESHTPAVLTTKVTKLDTDRIRGVFTFTQE